MSDTGEEWQVARRRKGTARKPNTLKVCSNSTCCQEPLDVRKTVKRIKDTVSELKCEEFWQEWKGECVGQVHILPIILQLSDPCSILVFRADVGSPLKTPRKQGHRPAAGEGKRQATKPTLFYLMHCGKALYNNLLWKNWSTQCLPLVIIIGNSFIGMRERTIEREFKRDYSYITQAVSVCEERQLPCPSRLIDVFSDTAVITFPTSSLHRLPQSTWAEPPEPQYQHCPDLEIIRNETQS
ncbi:SRR1-like protein [Nibea albiflora]|uniref:SRR1-like protein n=1 Tax=Nibea albiflora TaxID=240163 RepID=A0ACB7FC43_NIBAL|nr:SRR1-like protein [Nibea albiflora]